MVLKKNRFLGRTDMEQQERQCLTGILFLSMMIKCVLIFQTEIINPDGVRYLNAAHELFQGNISQAFAHDRNLVFAFLLGLFNLVVPDGFLAGKIMSSLLLLLSTVPLYFIARELFGKAAALGAGLAFTLFPTINSLSATIVREPPFVFFLLLSVWFVLSGMKKENWRFFVSAGVFALIAGAFRLEALLLFPVIVFYFAVLAFKCDQQRRFYCKSISALTSPPLFVLSAVLFVYMFNVGLSERFDELYLRFRAHYVKDGLFSRYQTLYEYLKVSERRVPGGVNPQDFFEIARHNLYLVYLIGLFESLVRSITPIFLLPLFCGLNLKSFLNRKTALLLCVVVGYLFLGYFVLLTRNCLSDRYLFSAVVLLVPVVGHGLQRIYDHIFTFRYPRAVLPLAFICIFLPVVITLVGATEEKNEIKVAGEWLKAKNTQSKLMTNDERIPFYAGLYRSNYITKRFLPGQGIAYEKAADKGGIKVVVLRSSKKNFHGDTGFVNFELVKEFGEDKSVIRIYEKSESKQRL